MSRNLALACAGLALWVGSARATGNESNATLRVQLLKMQRENEAIRDENRQIRDELGSLRSMLETLLAQKGAGGPARPSPAPAPAPVRPTVPPPDPVGESAEEAALRAEFEKSLGAAEAAGGVDPRKGTARPPMNPGPAGANGAWFMRQGGSMGFNNQLDLGVTSEAIFAQTSDGSAVTGNELADRFTLRETELAVGGYVDPFHRADILFTWNAAHDEVAIEEAFLTFYNLGRGFRGRVGKFRSRTGKVNGLHFADLPWVNFPMVNTRFLGEEGFGAPGARLTYLGEPKGKWSWSLDLEAFTGDSETLVNGTGLLPDPPGYAGDDFAEQLIQSAHLQNHFQLDDYQDLEVGLSRVHADGSRVKLTGLDLLWRKQPVPGRNEWAVGGEFMHQTREDLAEAGDDDERDGWFAFAERRFDQNNALGLRIEESDNLAPGAGTDRGKAVYYTFYPTEFSWYRLQFQEDELAAGITDRQVYVQFRWQLGVDRHAIQ